MKALLLIDLQNDFMPGGPLAVPDGLACVQVANQVEKMFNTIIATKDWHPQDHRSFAKSHPGKKPGDRIDLEGLEQTLWPTHCVQHTDGAALVRGLDQSNIQHVVTKGEDVHVDSYSAFFDNAHRRETGLARYLEHKHIDELYLIGLATEYCVKYSALDAIGLGYKTTVIVDGCRGIELNQGDIECALAEMRDQGVHLLTMADLL